MRHTLIALALASFASPALAEPPALPPEAERAAGWVTLFDGTSTEHWRGFKRDSFPDKGWAVEDGTLKVAAGGGGGDIITREQYGDFELELEFKVAPGANSGIMYRVTEAYDWPWMTGPEYQILDDSKHADGKNPMTSVAALYALQAPNEAKRVNPVGEWNTARIRLHDGVLQHYLNGALVVECRIDMPEWKDKIKASKFRDMPGFGIQPQGHISLQDHGDDVWYRNIRVRDLDASMPNEQSLLNGADLTGWAAYLEGGASMEEVWSVTDGVLVCKGSPAGYIKTASNFDDFVLKLEWRWNPETKEAGNSGVLFRVNGPDKVWPRSVEAQLQSGSAGDFWNIGEMEMAADPARTSGRNTRKLAMAERPVGEWNEYEIVCVGDRVRLIVNGQIVNEAWDVESASGPIALQSEGTEIHFRNIRVAPISN